MIASLRKFLRIKLARYTVFVRCSASGKLFAHSSWTLADALDWAGCYPVEDAVLVQDNWLFADSARNWNGLGAF